MKPGSNYSIDNVRGGFEVAGGKINTWVSPTKTLHGYSPLNLMDANGNPNLNNWIDHMYQALFGATRP